MSSAAASALPPEVDRQLEGLAPAELAVSVPTYNNVATVALVLEAIRAGLEKHFADASAVLINADAGSSDATGARLADAGLPLARAPHAAPPAQLATVPFHGVPGRGAALRLSVDVARRLGARALVVLEADITSIDAEWLERLLRPVLERGADLVMPVHARHRYDGTITNLVLAPLVSALYGRRMHQPLAGARALSAPFLDRLAADQRWPPPGRAMTDLWMEGTAIAEGFAVHEARLGQWRGGGQKRPPPPPPPGGPTPGGGVPPMGRYAEPLLPPPP